MDSAQFSTPAAHTESVKKEINVFHLLHIRLASPTNPSSLEEIRLTDRLSQRVVCQSWSLIFDQFRCDKARQRPAATETTDTN